MATRKEVAEALGMAPASLRDARLKADWFPYNAVTTNARGRAVEWDLSGIVAAYRDHQSHRDELGRIRARCLMAKVELLRMKVDELRAKNEAAQANVLPRAEWEAFVRDLKEITTREMSKLPAQLASLVTEPTLQDRIHREADRIIRMALNGLFMRLEQGPDE